MHQIRIHCDQNPCIHKEGSEIKKWIAFDSSYKMNMMGKSRVFTPMHYRYNHQPGRPDGCFQLTVLSELESDLKRMEMTFFNGIFLFMYETAMTNYFGLPRM